MEAKMRYQIVADRHAAVEIAYASTQAQARRVKRQMTHTCGCGATHSVEIREAGNFVPDTGE